jgi:DNA-binding IclR family transcriptional regulator
LNDSSGAPVAAMVIVGPERILPVKNFPSLRRAMQEAADDLQKYLK